MDVLEYVTVYCPYCGESNELSVERTTQAVSYDEDCQCCCRSMQVNVRFIADELNVSLARDDD